MHLQGVLLLGNHSIITKASPEQSRMEPNLDLSKIGSRIIDELVSAMKDIQLDDEELACIKALVFFDPSNLNDLIFHSINSKFNDLIFKFKMRKV